MCLYRDLLAEEIAIIYSCLKNRKQELVPKPEDGGLHFSHLVPEMNDR
jgi:hypothetical protein